MNSYIDFRKLNTSMYPVPRLKKKEEEETGIPQEASLESLQFTTPLPTTKASKANCLHID